MTTKTLLICLFGTLFQTCPLIEGFPGGAPAFACVGMTPMHWAPMTDQYSMDMQFYQPQTKSSDIKISMNPTSYDVSQNISITVEGKNSQKIRGLVLVVNRKTGDTDQPLGTFIECTPSDKVKFHSYYPQRANENNCVTHQTRTDVSKIECIWKTPEQTEGDLVISATIVKQKDEYWYRQTKDLTALKAKENAPLVSTLNTFPNLVECGVQKSCLVYPKLCHQMKNCQYMLSYKVNTVDKTINVEMSANNTGWVAMGLSKDEVMDKDYVVGCLETKEKGKATVVTATTSFTTLPGTRSKMHYLAPTIDVLRKIKNRKAGIVSDWVGNQKIVCSFDVPYKVTADFPGVGYDPLLFDLENEDVFVFMGDGVTFTGTNFMMMHSQRPLISPKIRLTSSENRRLYFEGMLYRTRVHGTLQIVAWMFCSSLAVVIARHYRPNLSKLLNKGPYKQWFLWHILLIIITMILSIISFIYILASNGVWKVMPTVHGSLGIVTIILALINIVMGSVGVVRCTPSNPKRKIFDWMHFIVGCLTRISAIVTFWLAIRIYGHRDMFDLVGTIIVAIWTAGEILFFFYFLLRKKLAYWRTKNEYSCPQTRTSLKAEYRSDSYVRHVGILSFLFYLVFIVGVTLALLFAIWLY